MLRRNIYFAPKSVKSKAYQATVLPILEYASNCWAPTLQKQSDSLKMVHHKATKFASYFYPKKGNYENCSITKILENMNWDTLADRRQQSRLTMAYKIINDHVILDPNLMPKLQYQRLNRKCKEVKVGYQNQLIEPPCAKDVVLKTFFFPLQNYGIAVSLHCKQMHLVLILLSSILKSKKSCF